MAQGRMKYIQAPYFATGDPESEEMTTLYAPGMLGCVGQYDRGSNNVCDYQLVKQASSISGVVGNVFYWGPKSTYTVTTTATNTGLLAGIGERVVVTAATYIWIVKHGNRPVLFIDSPTSACAVTGNPAVGVTATAGKADALALATAPQPMTIGRCTSTQDGTSKLASVDINIVDPF